MKKVFVVLVALISTGCASPDLAEQKTTPFVRTFPFIPLGTGSDWRKNHEIVCNDEDMDPITLTVQCTWAKRIEGLNGQSID